MPRALKRLRSGMLEGILGGVLRRTRRVRCWYSGGTKGTSCGGGVYVGVPRGLHARAPLTFADLSAAFETDAVQRSLGVNPH